MTAAAVLIGLCGLVSAGAAQGGGLLESQKKMLKDPKKRLNGEEDVVKYTAAAATIHLSDVAKAR
jgi:hypothetical protein